MFAHIVTASDTPIPASYDATSGSLVITNCPSGDMIQIINTTADVLAYTVGAFNQVPVSTVTSNRNQGFVPQAPDGTGTSAGVVIDKLKITQGDKLYIRATGGSTISSGKVFIVIK